MSRIHSKDTKPELLVRRHLFKLGFRYLLHDRRLSGKPDIVLPKYNSVIFVQGCFWHGHRGCKYFVVPKSRAHWWLKKINSNRQRDKANERALRADGWNVINVFECELKHNRKDKTLANLITKLCDGYSGN